MGANIGLTLLWIIGIIAIILAILALIYFSYRNTNSTNNVGPGFESPPCSESLSNLPDITDAPCCFFNRANSTLKYNRNFDLTLAPFPTYYLDVCIGFCPNGDFNYDTKQCVTTNPTALNKYNNCVNLLKPLNCQGQALPIAVSDGIAYYGFEAGNGNCTTCCSCGEVICDAQACV